MPEQIELIDSEDRVRRILLSRRKANASGQRGEDVQNIRAAYEMAVTPAGVARVGVAPQSREKNDGR